MANTNIPASGAGCVIRLHEGELTLTNEDLMEQAGAKILKHHNWYSPTLKFLSFKEGVLALQNSSEKRSYQLQLQVINTGLLVNCSCGENHSGKLCGHAYKALDAIIWNLGASYFKKLAPGGLLEMAFLHRIYFDKKETKYGLDAEPRPELESVYGITSAIPSSINTIMGLPGKVPKEASEDNADGLAYMVLVSLNNRIMPALLPCIGKLNKQGSEIKTFYPFISGIQKEWAHLLTPAQQEINRACHSLWKIVEKGPGVVIPENAEDFELGTIEKVFDAWQALFPVLQDQPLLYIYYLYRVEELKRKPDKKRTEKIKVSGLSPEIRFILVDKGAFFRLELQFWVNNKLLQDCDLGLAFFILHQHTLYLLSSIRDILMAHWMHKSGGWTIFKEHYAAFEKEVLRPLEQHYLIERKRPRKQIG